MDNYLINKKPFEEYTTFGKIIIPDKNISIYYNPFIKMVSLGENLKTSNIIGLNYPNSYLKDYLKTKNLLKRIPKKINSELLLNKNNDIFNYFKITKEGLYFNSYNSLGDFNFEINLELNSENSIPIIFLEGIILKTLRKNNLKKI